MKKIVLSLAGVLAATAFAPEAAAVPAFARQVGMACNACHAQHFPILNSFGRAFKAGGYTMMGAQGKVEGEHLSIPDTLNSSIVMKIQWRKDDSKAKVGLTTQAQGLGDGQWRFHDEFAMLLGGRVADNIGFMIEGQMIAAAPFAAGFKMPFVYDVGPAKLSVIPFKTDALDVQFGYELSSGGVMRANRWAENRGETSAIQYMTGDNPATGIAFVAQNDFGYVNISKYAAKFDTTGNGNRAAMSSTYIRAAATPNVAGWAMVVGLGNMSGKSWGGVAKEAVETEMTFFDFQAQGEVAGKELGVYLQQATAPKLKTTAIPAVSLYNDGGTNDKTALTIGADYSVIPHVLHIGAAFRTAKTGAATNDGDDAITLTAVYDLYQNVALHANFSTYSGTKYDVAGTPKQLTKLMLEAAW